METVPEMDSIYERSECASVVQSARMSKMSKLSMGTERTAKTFRYKKDEAANQRNIYDQDENEFQGEVEEIDEESSDDSNENQDTN
mgnify:CR=1 FL=1|jgi:hypothetical protein